MPLFNLCSKVTNLRFSFILSSHVTFSTRKELSMKIEIQIFSPFAFFYYVQPA